MVPSTTLHGILPNSSKSQLVRYGKPEDFWNEIVPIIGWTITSEFDKDGNLTLQDVLPFAFQFDSAHAGDGWAVLHDTGEVENSGGRYDNIDAFLTTKREAEK